MKQGKSKHDLSASEKKIVYKPLDQKPKKNYSLPMKIGRGAIGAIAVGLYVCATVTVKLIIDQIF